MKRRALLRAVAVGGAGVLAACVDRPADAVGDATTTVSPTEHDDSSPDGDDGSLDTDDATPAAEDETSTRTESAEPNEMTSRSFEVLETACGSDADVASVERGQNRVVVDGIIEGRNGCYTAELARAAYDDETDELTVDVRSYDDGGGGCMECIVDVDYRATFEFRDGTPGELHVRHDGDRVTTA